MSNQNNKIDEEFSFINFFQDLKNKSVKIFLNFIDKFNLFYQVTIYYFCIFIICFLSLSNHNVIKFIKKNIFNFEIKNLNNLNKNAKKIKHIRLSQKYNNLVKLSSFFIFILLCLYLCIKSLLTQLMKTNNCKINNSIIQQLNNISDENINFEEMNFYKKDKNINNKEKYIEYLNNKFKEYNDDCDGCIKTTISQNDLISNINDKDTYNCYYEENNKIDKFNKNINGDNQKCLNNLKKKEETTNYFLNNLTLFIIMLICINFFFINYQNINHNNQNLYYVKGVFYFVLIFLYIIYQLYTAVFNATFDANLYGVFLFNILLVIFLIIYDKICITKFVQMVLNILN